MDLDPEAEKASETPKYQVSVMAFLRVAGHFYAPELITKLLPAVITLGRYLQPLRGYKFQRTSRLLRKFVQSQALPKKIITFLLDFPNFYLKRIELIYILFLFSNYFLNNFYCSLILLLPP